MKKSVILSLALASALFNINEAFALDTAEELVLHEIPMVETASRRSQTITEAPAHVIVVTEQMIKERGYLDLKDIFNDLPGFDVSTNIYGEFSSLIYQRGVGANKMLLLLNGEKISNPDGKELAYGNNMPLGNVKKIEIVYGPGSAIYGPDAFGVVNIITKTPKETNGTHLHGSAGQFGTFDNWIHHGKKVSQNIGYSLFARSFLQEGQDLSGEYPSLAFIKTGYPRAKGVEPSYQDPVSDYNLNFHLDIKDFSVSFYRSYFHEQLSKALIPNHYVYNKDAYWAHTYDKVSVKHRYANESNFNLHSLFSMSVYEIEPNMNWYYLFDTDYSTLKVHQYGKINATKFEQYGDYTFGNGMNAMAGISAEDVTGLPVGDVTGRPFDRNSLLNQQNSYNTLYPQSVLSSQNYGIFAQLNIPIHEKLDFNAGARYDYNTIYKDVVNPRSSLIFKVSAALPNSPVYCNEEFPALPLGQKPPTL